MENHIIHIVLGKANPNRMNGVNKVVNSLAENQSLLGYKVSVWGITKNMIHNYPSRSYETRIFQDVGKFNLSVALKQAIKYMDGNVIFHLHGGFIPQLYRVSKLLKKRRLAYVFTPHGAYNSVALKRSKLKKRLYIQLFEKALVKNAKAIHLIGESEIIGTTKVFNEVPHQLIPNGQNKATIMEENSTIGNPVPVFGFVGRLDKHTKGLDLLLNGFAKFIEKTGGAGHLWLIGDGPDRTELEAMARDLKIEGHMKFLGAKYGEEKNELISQMDYLCLTSRNEGLPGVVLEAAAFGTPAIVSKETNMGKYVNASKAGFVLEENKADDIAMALVKAEASTKSGKIMAQGTAAKKMIEEIFNWEKIARQHLEFYAA